MTRFLAFLLFLLVSGQNSFAQLVVTKLDKAHLPKGIHYKGQLINALRWTDKAGNHVVITTETGEFPSKEGEDFRSMRLAAQHFLLTSDSLRQTWQMQDGVTDCPVDMMATFTKNTFQVTDLNKDGLGEVWLMYKTVCHGDVSPVTMKIIMYQGAQKFAMRGRNRVKVSATESEGGEYQFDPAFQAGPKEFRMFALALWQKNVWQVWQ